jgi:hypothetical protein
MIPLVLLVLFSTSMNRITSEDASGRIRCDELYYFVQDVEHDLERAMLIFGRRAAIYAIDDVVSHNRTMWNYTYTNCSGFNYEGNGSEAAISELVLCGTLYGENVTYMINHTVPIWLGKIATNAEELHYDVDIGIINLTVVPYDAWNFALILTTDIAITDGTGLCYYEGDPFQVQSLANIIGLEDPLYPLNTNNRVKKYIYNCSSEILLNNQAGCSKDDAGSGIGPGKTVFVSEIGIGNLADFCNNPVPYGYEYDASEIIVAFDQAIGACSQLPETCVSINSSNHLAGIIDMGPNSPIKLSQNCNVTIPWISDTGKIDNVTGEGIGWAPGCSSNRTDINDTGQCVVIKNIDGCGVHQVLIGYDSADLNTTCYTVSDISRYNETCGSELPDGPSFFDRLDGRLNLSDKYRDQAVEYYENPYVGIETIVSLPNELAYHGVDVDENATWIDYLYWQGVPGSPASVVCQSGTYDFKLDCPHAYAYSITTGSANATGERPQSEITEPADGATYSGCPSVTINGTADDCDGSVESVTLKINDVAYETVLVGSQWSKIFSTNLSYGDVLTWIAEDDDGIIDTRLEEISLFITGCGEGDNNPPDAPEPVGPPNGETGVEHDPGFFAWERVSDNSGIYRYEIEVSQTSAPTYTFSDYASEEEYSMGLNNDKWHAWRVRAQDNAGNWGNWSSAWTFKT